MSERRDCWWIQFRSRVVKEWTDVGKYPLRIECPKQMRSNLKELRKEHPHAEFRALKGWFVPQESED